MSAEIEHRLNEIGCKAMFIGAVGGDSLTLPGEAPISLADLRKAHENWLPAYMGADAAE